MTKFTLPIMSGLMVLLVGCSDNKIAPVSGVVTVDGKPYPDAVVTFQPLGTPESPNPGRGSSAYTDENGRFVLMQDGDEEGAIIGKHRVRIMTKGNEIVSDPDTGSSDEVPAGKTLNIIPPEWNTKSEKDFDVPPDGTDQANFDIISTRAKRK